MFFWGAFWCIWGAKFRGEMYIVKTNLYNGLIKDGYTV